MKIYQTTEPESIRSIAKKHCVSERALAALNGLTPRGIVPAGVSLLLPLGARGGGSCGRLYPEMNEERAEILVLAEETPRRTSLLTEGLPGMMLASGGVLTRRGFSRLRRCPPSDVPVCLAAGAWGEECPPPSDIAEALLDAGYRGLLLPVIHLSGHRLVSALPELIAAFAERGLIFALALPDSLFLRQLPLFSCLDTLPDFFRLTPPAWEMPLEVRARELADATDLTLRRRLLLSLPSGAAFTTHEKSAPLPYGEALRIVSAAGARPRREDILMASVTRGKSGGTVYMEDPVSLLAGLMRLSVSKFGGVALSEDSAPFAGEMIRRLFRTAGGKGCARSQT